MISASVYSAVQLVFFFSNPVDPHGWDGQDEDLLFAQHGSVSGRFALPWKLRTMAREAASKEVANSKQSRLVARKRALNGTAVRIGDSALF